MTQIRKCCVVSPEQAARSRAAIDALLCPELFRALGDPTRVSLLACLAKCRRPATVSEVAACCAVDLSVVSRHLALLQQTGVLHARKEGRTVWYSVRYAELSRALRDLADAIDECCPPSALSVEQPSTGHRPGGMQCRQTR